jgi:hypothetical protein
MSRLAGGLIEVGSGSGQTQIITRSQTDHPERMDVLSPGEINKSMLHVSPHQLCPQLIANVQPLGSLGQQSFDMWLHDANKRPLWSDSGDDGIEGFTHPMAHCYGGQPLRHFPLHFSRRVAFLGAV